MSQFGMQMPGGRKRSSSPDVYTGLVVIATVFLAAASFIMFTAASKVGLNGSAFGLQDAKSIKLPAAATGGGGSAAPAPAAGGKRAS